LLIRPSIYLDSPISLIEIELMIGSSMHLEKASENREYRMEVPKNSSRNIIRSAEYPNGANQSLNTPAIYSPPVGASGRSSLL
jgi:hypothetical protein